ncbi:unnamed protein product [Phytomonas sp. EM1]|nr:unnamed protein product [Phytomonas sp. EM1]|eukprot:CCW62048.1 unnamed protein product [Phytomonas sp. isolate EM1]
MLDSVAAILANDLSRLCLHREEDYELLVQVYHRHIAEDHVVGHRGEYYALLLEELRKRERWHRQCEKGIVTRMVAWNQGIIENQMTLAQTYAELGSCQSLWCECIQHAYQLSRNDLESSPFARQESSRMLYDGGSSSVVSIVHEQLFQGGESEAFVVPGVKERLDALYPPSPSRRPYRVRKDNEALEGMDDAVVEPALNFENVGSRTRNRLFKRRREFQIFFIIWLHAMRQGSVTEGEMAILSRLPAIAVTGLLKMERRRLEDMLAKVNDFI